MILRVQLKIKKSGLKNTIMLILDFQKVPDSNLKEGEIYIANNKSGYHINKKIFTSKF